MSSFELDKLDWYEVQNAELNDFINENLTSEEYGVYFSVKFVGDADTYLWQTKTEPVVGEKYWGMLQKAKSGKSIKFKWDKKNTPDSSDSSGYAKTTSQSSYKDNSKNITLGLVWKILIGIQGVPENDEQFAKFYETVDAHVSELLDIADRLNGEKS